MSCNLPPFAVHARHLAPLLRLRVEHLDGVQSVRPVVTADGVEPVAHHGDADT